MPDARTTYTEAALRSLPRLLTLEDRNPLTPTYGCFHRDYWLYRTSDFPDAVRQFGVHALALAYAANLPRNPYYRNPNVRTWALAGMEYWTRIQHADGSFDEFYPYERGWVGPTAFTTYAISESLRLLRAELPAAAISRIEQAIRRAALFVTHGEAEKDFLANHHAMAHLAVSAAADALNDASLRAALPRLWETFLTYHHPEGWSREYDGADPGYLTATISFLAKVYVRHPDPDMLRVLREAVEFASYFLYPSGSYSGTIGSRNTLHVYPHGFELLSDRIPLAASIAEQVAHAVAEGTLVSPEVMSDRYVHYRVPEFLLAAVDARARPPVLAQLPYERPNFVRHFPAAGVVASVHGSAYTVANLSKGGVVKSFDRQAGTVRVCDTGWLGELTDGTTMSSQWISSSTTARVENRVWIVSGQLQVIPKARVFTLWTHLVFRLALAAAGWYAPAAHWLKGTIRQSLILTGQPVPAYFTRTIEATEKDLILTDELKVADALRFRRLLLGGDIPLRYVPQSRFFQRDELSSESRELTQAERDRLHQGETVRIVRQFPAQHPRR